MSTYDPNAICELVWCSASATLITASSKLVDGSRLDVGNYEHLLLTVCNGGGASGATIVPRVSQAQTGPEFDLDGTTGAPDFRMVFTSNLDTGARSIVIPVAELNSRFRFFNVAVVTTSFRPIITLYGFGLRSTSVNRTIIGRKAPVPIAP